MKVLLIGGTRYFGKRLVHKLLDQKNEVWVLSRGNVIDDFGERVHRLKADRNNEEEMKQAVEGLGFDVVVDQVCLTPQQAEAAVRVFAGKVEYYLMTSTMSVYDLGADLREQAFEALNYIPKTAQNPMEEYAEGKRAAENVFTSQKEFKCGFARFPLVTGEDDYTLRLYDHVRKVQEGRPVYFPNLQARLSFIQSEDAAKALLWMAQGRREGAYNFGSREPVVLEDLMRKIESITGKKALLLTEPSPENWSPFGVPADWYLNVDRAVKEGFEAQSVEIWFEPLLKVMAK